MTRYDKVDFWPGVRTRGLRGVSAFMAAFCGLAATLVAILTIVLFVGLGTTMVTASPNGETSWRSGSVNIQTTWHREITGPCSPTASKTSCQSTPAPAALPAREIATILLALSVGALPLLALTYGLLEACLCFLAMAKGRFLDRGTVARLARFAIGGLLFVLLFPHAGAMAAGVAQGLASLFDLLAHTPQPTFRSSQFNFVVTGLSEWLNAIYALTLTVIAVVMARASSIAEDHAQIV